MRERVGMRKKSEFSHEHILLSVIIVIILAYKEYRNEKIHNRFAYTVFAFLIILQQCY